MSESRGVDVSGIGQGQFNWSAWAGHIDFGIAKATEGTDFVDPEFARNWEAMGDLGIYRFAYHYFHPSVDPVSQVEFFLDTIEPLGVNPDGDNLILDHETTDGMAPVDVSFAAWVFCTEINRMAPDHRCVVYTYPFFAIEGNCAKLGAWPLCIANYGVPVPWVPAPWSEWSLWQESANPGGNKDLFNGDKNKLTEFCTSTGLWTP